MRRAYRGLERIGLSGGLSEAPARVRQIDSFLTLPLCGPRSALSIFHEDSCHAVDCSSTIIILEDAVSASCL